jgi:hypothetical protein
MNVCCAGDANAGFAGQPRTITDAHVDHRN